jgi:hypothetical protein
MSFITKLFSGGVKEIAGGVKSIIGSLKLDPAKKAETELAVDQLVYDKFAKLEDSFQTEVQAKERIIVAELNQGDNYTKRARPSIIYTGLVIVIVNFFAQYICAWAGIEPPDAPVPAEFWMGWSGLVATYSIGRTLERRGVNNKIISLITGNKRRSILDD